MEAVSHDGDPRVQLLVGNVRWSGFLGQETGIYKWKTAPGSCSCRSLSQRLGAQVNHSRGLPVKVLVPSTFGVEREVGASPFFNPAIERYAFR